ncbi:MAG TPA: hypothetical protein DIV41_00850, partial [Ruminococcaceae bacterium]|nr:hypothetical protein [Oscillospiraceae bacterium]
MRHFLRAAFLFRGRINRRHITLKGDLAVEEYKTIGRESRSEFTVKRSKFISSAKPVETPDEAEKFIRSVRAEHFDAKHNVFAYRTLGGAQKCS